MPVETESADVSMGQLLPMQIGAPFKTTAARHGPFFFVASVESLLRMVNCVFQKLVRKPKCHMQNWKHEPL
jgi:hypothetical protein